MNQSSSGYEPVIEEICSLGWDGLTPVQLSHVAWAYYYFSIQFRENLQIALKLNPADLLLQSLVAEECATSNLSPWPDVAAAEEALDHDEFMRRVLLLSPVEPTVQRAMLEQGEAYLARIRRLDDNARALSIVSYEDGGLERVFGAMLRATQWGTPLLQGFRHFLLKHIDFDSSPEQGHGAMIRHFVPDDSIRCLWVEFRNLLVSAVPELARVEVFA